MYIVKESVLKFQCYHSDIKVCLLSYLDIFRNLGHYIWYEGVYEILADVITNKEVLRHRYICLVKGVFERSTDV